MLKLFAIPQSHTPNIFRQEDGAPLRWGKIIRRCLDAQFDQRWTERDGALVWPPRSPDLASFVCFFVGICQEQSLRFENDRYYTAQKRIIKVIENIPLSM